MMSFNNNKKEASQHQATTRPPTAQLILILLPVPKHKTYKITNSVACNLTDIRGFRDEFA